MKAMKKKFRGILAVVVAGIMMLAMAVTVAAQEPSAEESQPAAAAEPAVQEPSAEEPSVEPNPEPTLPTSAPEASETPEPTPSAAESNAPEPSLPTENVPAETAQPEPEEPPAERQPDAPAPQDETQALAPAEGSRDETPGYDVPAVFLSDISAKGNDDTLALTEKQLEEIEKNLPAGLGPYRREIVLKAYSLVGRVNYFWGGKSTASGWDVRWGNDAVVGSAGSSQTGTIRSYGLDCSGYVLWCMLNAEESFTAQQNPAWPFDKAGLTNQIGYGTAGQWAHSYEIPWEEAQPGDIVFYKNPQDAGINHVGILVGTDEEGATLVAHCSSSKNNVVISSLEGSGFCYVRRLAYLDGRETAHNQQEEAKIKVSTAPNGLPLMLTEEQAYEGAILNGWTVN